MSDNIAKAIELIRNASSVVALTGAGASTESGIPDFRSSGGLANTAGQKPYAFEEILSRRFFLESPGIFYDFYRSNLIYKGALPNGCHRSLAGMEKLGHLDAVITQNIDGLHQLAGSVNVIELHGNIHRNYCMNCRKSFDLDYITDSSAEIPLCDTCSGIVRPDVVLYQECLDEQNLERSVASVRHADVLIVIGTSLVVYPAAGLVDYYRGNKLILINKSSTPYDSKANVLINDSAGIAMDKILQALH